MTELDPESEKVLRSFLEKKITRRKALSTVGKVVAGAVAVAAIGGGAYAYYATQRPSGVSSSSSTSASTAASGYKPATGSYYLNGNAYNQPFTDMDFKGTSIRGVVDSGLNYLEFVDPDEGYPNSVTSGPHFGQNQVPKFEAATGIDVTMDAVDAGDTYSLYMTDLVSGTGKWNLIDYFSPYNGDIMGGGYTVPIGDLVSKYGVDTSPMYSFIKELYCSWNGQLMALPYDGDFHAYYYRKDLFADSATQSAFKSKLGYSLAPPQTWSQYLDIAKFFTKDFNPNSPTQWGLVEDWLDLSEEQWMQRFASYGGIYFDQDMNPQVNTPAGIQAAQDMMDALQYAPTGDTSLGWTQVIEDMLNGTAVQSVAWPDIGPRAGSGTYPVKGDQVGTALPPGANVGGTLIQRSLVSPGRVMAISKFTPTEKIEPAFLLMNWMYQTSPMSIPSGLNGEDPTTSTVVAPGALPYWQASNPGWSAAGINDYIAAAGKCLSNGYPDIYLPGQAQYANALEVRLGSMFKGELTPSQAMAGVNDDWVAVTKDIGLPKQQALWRQVLVAYQKLGLMPPATVTSTSST